MSGPGETGIQELAPKGNAKALRQKGRVMTTLCRVALMSTPKVQPAAGRESLRYLAEAQSVLWALCAFYFEKKETCL